MKKIIRWFRRLDPNCVKKARNRLVQHRYDKAAIVMAKMADDQDAIGNHANTEYIRLVNFAIQASRHLN